MDIKVMNAYHVHFCVGVVIIFMIVNVELKLQKCHPVLLLVLYSYYYKYQLPVACSKITVS